MLVSLLKSITVQAISHIAEPSCVIHALYVYKSMLVVKRQCLLAGPTSAYLSPSSVFPALIFKLQHKILYCLVLSRAQFSYLRCHPRLRLIGSMQV